jgi:hypothetical protein
MVPALEPPPPPPEPLDLGGVRAVTSLAASGDRGGGSALAAAAAAASASAAPSGAWLPSRADSRDTWAPPLPVQLNW